MRIITILVFLALVCGCPQVKQGPSTGTTDPVQKKKYSAPAKKLAVVYSSTESEPWVKELVTLAGSRLGVEPWSVYASVGHLDVYGPYTGSLEERGLDVAFIMTNLISVPGLEGQEAVAKEVLDWLGEVSPDVVWLDGDVAQFQVGRQLDKNQARIFTGVVLNKDFYYDEGEKITGVQKWHSVSAVFSEIWSVNIDAKVYALMLDDSPYSLANLRRFLDVKGFLPPDMDYVVMPTVHNWKELAGGIDELTGSADALIVCGMGGEGCSKELIESDCPADILDGIEIPVVALGPTRMDHTGLKSLKIKTAVHVDEAFDRIVKVIEGVDPRSLPVETPDDMSLFFTERDDQSNTSEPDA